MDIHDYAAQGDCDRVRKELRNRVAVDTRDGRDYTPLACAVSKAELLHAQGCRLETADRGGDTALMVAATNGNTEMLRWLVEHGADLEAVNGMDSTALMIAARRVRHTAAAWGEVAEPTSHERRTRRCACRNKVAECYETETWSL